MSWLSGTGTVSGALPVVAIIAVTGIVALYIAGWVIRDVARTALKQSSGEEVPHVLAALAGLLEQLRLFLPWQGRSRRSATPEIQDDQPTRHTENTRDLSKGGSQ